jgi:general secretion pathway protein K
MGAHASPHLRPQRGIALVAVLWMVAALSIVVTSISSSVRQEVKAVSASRESLVGQALGQAAIQLVLQDLSSKSGGAAQALSSVDTVFKDTPIRVRVLPLTGLIDINNAPPALLAALFRYAGADAKGAQALAAAAAEWRSAKDSRGRPVGFEAPEDLLRVRGIDYTLYARLSELVTADIQGNGRVSPPAAPEEVHKMLAGGTATPPAGHAMERGSARDGIDPTALNGEFTDNNAPTRRFRLDARVPLSGGSWLIVSRTVDFSGSLSGLHWRTLHTNFRFESVPLQGG